MRFITADDVNADTQNTHEKWLVIRKKWIFSIYSHLISLREKFHEEMMDVFETHLNWI